MPTAGPPTSSGGFSGLLGVSSAATVAGRITGIKGLGEVRDVHAFEFFHPAFDFFRV